MSAKRSGLSLDIVVQRLILRRATAGVLGRVGTCRTRRSGLSSVGCLDAFLRRAATADQRLIHYLVRRDVMTSQKQELQTVIPDLRNIPLDRLAEIDSAALAHSIIIYRERLKENGVPLSSFNARI